MEGILTVAKQPKQVGWWIWGQTAMGGHYKIAAYKKPRWLTRIAMKHVFEAEWEDA